MSQDQLPILGAGKHHLCTRPNCQYARGLRRACPAQDATSRLPPAMYKGTKMAGRRESGGSSGMHDPTTWLFTGAGIIRAARTGGQIVRLWFTLRQNESSTNMRAAKTTLAFCKCRSKSWRLPDVRRKFHNFI